MLTRPQLTSRFGVRQGRIEECNCTHYDKLWQMGMDADNGDFFARLQDEFQDFRAMVRVSLPDPDSDTRPPVDPQVSRLPDFWRHLLEPRAVHVLNLRHATTQSRLAVA
jgi:hypothetical protein